MKKKIDYTGVEWKKDNQGNILHGCVIVAEGVMKPGLDLIAAAPDLLSALRRSVEEMERAGFPDYHKDLVLSLSRAAIRKAEGR